MSTMVGQGEPIVFLHNGGNDHRIWDHQIAYFARTHRVIATDHIGFGESDKPDLEYTLPLFTEMVATLIDELQLAPVTLIGHCIGGAMAINYTRGHTDKVNRHDDDLVLFDQGDHRRGRRATVGARQIRFG